MTLSEILLCSGLMSGGWGLLYFSRPLLRKLGLFMICASTTLAAFFLTHQGWVVFFVLFTWVLIPLSEIVFLIRTYRVPRYRFLLDGLPPSQELDQLRRLTAKLHQLGFEQIDQCQLSPGVHDEYYRLFLHEEKAVAASITYKFQGGFGFHFVTFYSQDRTGRLWITWDYPFTYGLKMPPEVALYRYLECKSAEELFDAHQAFLDANEVKESLATIPGEAHSVRCLIEKALQSRLEYNLRLGILFLDPSQEEKEEDLRYSWRGALFVAMQVFHDLVRL